MEQKTNGPSPENLPLIGKNAGVNQIVVNGVATPMPEGPSRASDPVEKKGFFTVKVPSSRFMNGLFIINLVVVGLPLLFMLYLGILAKGGASGTEFFALMLLPIVPFTFLALIANLVYIPLFLLKAKPKAGYWLIGGLLLLLSIYTVGVNLYSLVHPRSTTSSVTTATPRKPVAHYKMINTVTALNVLKGCQVEQLVGYNGDITLVDPNVRAGVEKAEASVTGLWGYVEADGTMTSLYMSKALTPQILPDARFAREKCVNIKELRIYIDNTLEMKYPDGVWRAVPLQGN